MAENWMLKAVLSARDNMSPVLKAVSRTARSTRKYLTDVGSSAGNLANQVGLPLGLIAGGMSALTFAGLKQTVQGFADLAGSINDGARAMQVSRAQFQMFKYMGEQSNVPIEALSSSMGRLNKGIGMAAAGKNKELASLLNKAGIAMRGANGEIRSGVDLLPEVADLLQRNTNEAVRARIGNALFGKSWAELMPLLGDGSDGLNDLMLRYKELGIAVDDKAILAGDAFGDQLDDLRRVTESYANTIAAKLIPTLGPLVEQTIQWMVANREMISTNIANYMQEIATSLSQVDWSGVIQGARDFVSGVKGLVDWLGGAKNAFLWLVFVMNIQTVTAFIGLMGSVWRLVWALGAMTATAIPASIAGLKSLGGAMATAGTKANTLIGLLGKVGSVGAAAMAGWEIGSWLNDNVINPSVQKLTGQKDQTLGGWFYDALHPEEAAAMQQQSILGAGASQVSGKITVDFQNAPEGMRVTETKAAGPVGLDLNAGYRSYALGAP